MASLTLRTSTTCAGSHRLLEDRKIVLKPLAFEGDPRGRALSDICHRDGAFPVHDGQKIPGPGIGNVSR